ncbi:hypothetical protein TrVGV298_010605 [Trichoderma virens]|nr:hypothetical protein TrVGV298_010605 [Trichoderma virens]
MALSRHKALILCTVFIYVMAVLGKASLVDTEQPVYFQHQRRALANPPIPASSQRLQNASSVNAAENLVTAAIVKQGAYNKHRVANPRRNAYKSKTSSSAAHLIELDAQGPAAPNLTDELRAAAALLAERDAAEQLANGTLHKSYAQFAKLPRPFLNIYNDDENKKSRSLLEDRATSNSSYWVAQLSENGRPSMGYDTSYPVYRDVTNPMFGGGAKGDGVTDDTAAINAAIAYGGNCGENCLSSSVKGTLIYFPPGTYLISTPINAYYYSQLVGDANDIPIIKTSASFIGLGAIQSDVYIPNDNGNEWYVEQSNFYRQVRNFVIDISDTTTANAAGLHWQVGQATSVTNVAISASQASGDGNTQMGMYTENGSGGFMSDVTIVGGAYGIYGGNQQYTVRNFQIIEQTTACICLIWDWGWTWSGLYLSTAPIGISLINPQGSAGGGAITGSTYVMDSQFFDLTVGLDAAFNKTILESSIITLDNIDLNAVQTVVTYANGDVLEGIPTTGIDFVVIGNVENDGSNFGQFEASVPDRPSGLVNSVIYDRPLYYTKSRPQYETLSSSSIISVKDHGAVGDGVTDDTAAINSALALATTENLIYFPAGSYIVTSTIIVPAHTRMTGSVWSQLVASGSYFADAASPKVMLQVGNSGDVGTVEISDMLFTSIGPLPGLILVEWNVQAASQGSVGIWDAHFRIGGAYGTKLQVAQCPASSPIQAGCIAAAMMLHITPEANGYFENVWAWVADHDIDDAQNTQITVAVARGILIESSGPNWLYGTASEHSILYQYNFANTSNTFAGMIQTESPYYQFTEATESPGPFNSSVGMYSGDPIFPDSTCNGTALLCNFAWAVLMQGTTNLTIAGAGLYSWYDNYIETCVDTQNCQQRLVYDDGNNGGLHLWNLVTIGSVEMISDYSGDAILAKPNTQASGHPFWSALAGYLDSSSPEIWNCDWNDTSPDCQSTSLCDLTVHYQTVADLSAAQGSFPDQCMDNYALDTLGSVLNDTMNNYTQANDGYDDVFGDYQSYMHELIPEMIQNFMAGSSQDNEAGGAGNQFFDCTCEGYGPTSTQRCPFTWTQLAGADSFKMTYTLINSTGFYDTLQSQYGINASWVTFTDKHDITDTFSAGCERYETCVRTDYQWINIPTAASDIEIPNPKDVITKALPTIGTLQNGILARKMDLNVGLWNGSSDDLLQVYSMPVFMLSQAVTAMQNAKALGKQYEREKKIELILEILGAVFAFLPFLDDIAPELELIDGLYATVADVGNVALTIQSIVSNPASAPMDILGLITGAGGRDRDEIADIADKRRALSDTELSDIGNDFKEKDDEFQEVIAPTCRT